MNRFFLIITLIYSFTIIAQNKDEEIVYVAPKDKITKFESERYSYSDNSPGIIWHDKKTEILLINESTWKFFIPTKNKTLEILVVRGNEPSVINRIFTVNDQLDFSGYLIKESKTITLLLRNEVNCEKIEVSYRNVKKMN